MFEVKQMVAIDLAVSMKSGLEGRNNEQALVGCPGELRVSMKSGLEGRNNMVVIDAHKHRLN